VEGRSQCWSLYPGGSTGDGQNYPPFLNLFMNITRRSDILGKGVKPPDPLAVTKSDEGRYFFLRRVVVLQLQLAAVFAGS